MDGQRGRKGVKPSNELVEADVKAGNSKEENLKGLGALLFDDATPSTRPKSEQDVIQKTLNAIGVTYSHMNDDILVPSRIEAERTKQTLIKTRKRKSQAREKGDNEVLSTVQWPPKRHHHQVPPRPTDQLTSRHKALVQLGMINSPSDVPAFARDFARQSEEAQREILAELDRWAEMQVESDDSSDSD